MEDINLDYIFNITPEQYSEAVNYILQGKLPQDKNSGAVTRFKRRWKDAEVKVKDGKSRLFIENREVISTDRIEEVLSQLYDDPATGGGIGRDRFHYRVMSLYIGISRSSVEKFIQNDEAYQLHRRVFNKPKVIRPLPVPDGPNIRWQMDLINMGRKKQHDNLGYQYVLTVIDTFSKYAWVKKIKCKEGQEVSAMLKEILESEGAPHIIQSDNGSEFKNRWISELADHYNFQQVFSSPYRPQSQGCVER